MTPGEMPPPEAMSTAWLVDRFGSTDAPGWSDVVESADGEQTFSRTGGPAVMCWASAQEVVAELGGDRALTTGYFCRDDSPAAIADHAEGHDLALVDGRFLVDGWAAFVAEIGPCVLDLRDRRDRETAMRLHEPFGTWTTAPEIPEGTEEQTGEAEGPIPEQRYAA
jgi:hypothetical protein